jgi:hypothetical protein
MEAKEAQVTITGFRGDRDTIPEFIDSIRGLVDKRILTNLKPYLPSFAKSIILTFSSPYYAQQAKLELQSRRSDFSQSSLYNEEALCIYVSSTPPVPFSIMISDFAGETEESLASAFKKFGALHVPNLPSVKVNPSNTGALINFTLFEDAMKALDTIRARKRVLGSSLICTAQPFYYTRLILRLKHLSRAPGHSIPMETAANCAQQVANQNLSEIRRTLRDS